MEHSSKPHHQHSLALMAFAAVFHGTCSASMNFFNKFLLNSWSFDFPEAVILAQLVVTSMALKALKIAQRVNLVEYNYANARTCGLLSTFFFTNTLLALFALEGMNVPMYNSLRRCVPMASLILGYFWLTKRPTKLIVWAIIVITTGTAIAATGDLQFDAKSYIIGTISVFLMALYVVTLQLSGTEKHLTTLDLLYINSLNCVPMAFLLCAFTSRDLLSYAYYNDWRFGLSFVLVSVAGCVLNYSMFLCTTVNSALTTTCVGVIKSVFTTVIGMFVLGGVVPTVPFLGGQLINFAGGALYVYAKYREKKDSDKHAAQEILKA